MTLENVYPLNFYRILPHKQLKPTLGNADPSLPPISCQIYQICISGIPFLGFFACYEDHVLEALKLCVNRKVFYTL